MTAMPSWYKDYEPQRKGCLTPSFNRTLRVEPLKRAIANRAPTALQEEMRQGSDPVQEAVTEVF